MSRGTCFRLMEASGCRMRESLPFSGGAQPAGNAFGTAAWRDVSGRAYLRLMPIPSTAPHMPPTTWVSWDILSESTMPLYISPPT